MERPYDERLGFTVLVEQEWTDDLRRIRAAETAHGLDPAIRVVMARMVGGSVRPQ